MKPRGQIVGEGFDGFDRNVAEKMPKIRKEEEPASVLPPVFPPVFHEEEPPPVRETAPETVPPERPAEKRPIFTPQPREGEGQENLEILKLIEDLHAQLLASNRTRKAVEIDLISSQKTIQQLVQENRALTIQVEGLKKEVQRFEETQSEIAYLEEENEDALGRITGLQGEFKSLNETLAKTTQERDRALTQIQALEARIDQNDLLRIKGKLREREVSRFSEENEELRRRLEEAMTLNMDLEKKYGTLKKSFNEVKESLTLLRDTCKASYYNLPNGRTAGD